MNVCMKLSLLFMGFVIAGCVTNTDRQQGGNIDVNTPNSTINVQQPENAETPARLDFTEDGAVIRYDRGDILSLNVETRTDGTIIKRVDFEPQNPNEMRLNNTSANGGTGSSYEDLVGQLNVFLQHAKLIMWVGIGFLAAGGLWAGIFRDIKTGIILGGIGALMLGGYAILPQIYTHWLLILVIGVVAVPVIWWLTHRQNTRISKASIASFEKLKTKYPDIAKEMSSEFKAVLHPKDIEKAKKLKSQKI